MSIYLCLIAYVIKQNASSTAAQGSKAMNRLMLMTLLRRNSEEFFSFQQGLKESKQTCLSNLLSSTEISIREGLTADRFQRGYSLCSMMNLV